jgi:hypothetical protein
MWNIRREIYIRNLKYLYIIFAYTEKNLLLSGRVGNVIRSDIEHVLNDLSQKKSLSNFTLQIM